MDGLFKKSLRIAIDGRMIKPHAMHGIARYVYQLVKCIGSRGSQHRFFIFVSEKSPLYEAALPSFITLLPTPTPWISFREQWTIPRLLRHLKIDLFHSPSFVAPFFCPCKLIMTIHDLNHIMLPQYYTLLHQFYYNTVVRYSMKRSVCILTVSIFSKNEIIKNLHVPEKKVFVTYNGVSDYFSPIDSKDFLNYVRELYGLPNDFIFCLTNNKPHKNVMQLVKAYVHANINVPLVLIGPANHQLIEISERYGKKHQLYFIKFIEEEHLPTVYSLCKFFVYPSSYEGFGLPPIEALACGAPVAVANASSLPEVVGDSAIFVDPTDFKKMGRTMEDFIKFLENGNPNREKGIQHAKKFSWATLAEKTLKIYEQCFE